MHPTVLCQDDGLSITVLLMIPFRAGTVDMDFSIDTIGGVCNK